MEPPLYVKLTAPLAFMVNVLPKQTVPLLTLMVGVGATVRLRTTLEEQPTVYDPVIV